MADLKPCPFCGGTTIHIDYDGPYYKSIIGCKCGAQTVGLGFRSSSEAEAIAAWNLRATEAEATGKQGVGAPDWFPYLSDRADGCRGHYAIARKNPTKSVPEYLCPKGNWVGYGAEVFSLEEACAMMREVLSRAAPSATDDVAASGDFDAWMANPYTNVLQKSITEDYVPKADAGVASVSDGYALVPVVTTDAMNAAGVKAAEEFHHGRADAVDAVFAAMLAAAPTPTAPDDVASIYLGRLRNGSTTWLEFTMEAWEKLDASWDRATAAKQENHHGQ